MWSNVPPMHATSYLKRDERTLISAYGSVRSERLLPTERLATLSYSCYSSITPIAGRNNSIANVIAFYLIWSMGTTCYN